MNWQDPKDPHYRLDWQNHFGRSAKARGMVSAVAAQQWISQIRAMRRLLKIKPAPSWKDWQKIFMKQPGRKPDHWILDRCKKRIDKAIARGATHSECERRNLFDAWRGHSYSRNIARLRQRIVKPQKNQ